MILTLGYCQDILDSMEIEQLQKLAAVAGQTQQDDLEDALGHVRLVEIAAAQARRELVAELRGRGASWQAIGDVLGVSRQAAFERFGSAEK